MFRHLQLIFLLNKLEQLNGQWSFNLSKSKQVTFLNHWLNHEYSPVTMNAGSLSKAPCFERLLGLMFTPDVKWDLCDQLLDAGKMVGSPYRSRKYLTPAMYYFYKSQIRPKMYLLPRLVWYMGNSVTLIWHAVVFYLFFTLPI